MYYTKTTQAERTNTISSDEQLYVVIASDVLFDDIQRVVCTFIRYTKAHRCMEGLRQFHGTFLKGTMRNKLSEMIG